jgi:hypothetical protein
MGERVPLTNHKLSYVSGDESFSYTLFENLEEEHEKRRKTRMLETAEGRK